MEKRISVLHILASIGVIIGIVGGIYGLGQFVDNRIKSTLNEEQFIKKVASHVRPYVIFDVNETVWVNGGAMQYLEKIEVEQVMGKGGLRVSGLNIIITPKSHLAYAPLLETITLTMFHVSSKRGSRHQWIYELTKLSSFGLGDKEEPERFRLEILR